MAKCEYCDKDFTQNKIQQKYCSKKCRGEAWKYKAIAQNLCFRCGNTNDNLPIQRCNKCAKKHNDHSKVWGKDYRKRSEIKTKMKEYHVSRKEQIKRDLLTIYGSECECCGCDTIEFLTLEHKHKNGTKHREETGSSLRTWQEAIKNVDFEKYTILCMNCNWFQRFGKECPCKKDKIYEYEVTLEDLV